MTDEQIKSRFAEAGDFVTRTLRCDGNTLYAYYIDGLTSGGDISEYVFRPIRKISPEIWRKPTTPPSTALSITRRYPSARMWTRWR